MLMRELCLADCIHCDLPGSQLPLRLLVVLRLHLLGVRQQSGLAGRGLQVEDVENGTAAQ